MNCIIIKNSKILYQKKPTYLGQHGVSSIHSSPYPYPLALDPRRVQKLPKKVYTVSPYYSLPLFYTGRNKVLSRDKHSLSSSSSVAATQEQFATPSDSASVPHVHMQNQGTQNLEYGAGTGSSQSTEDEASWI